MDKPVNNNSIGKTLFVAAATCLVCGVLVALSAVGLKDKQIVNERKFFQKNVLMAAGIYQQDMDVLKAFEKVEPVLVDLDKGEINTTITDIAAYDQRKAKKIQTMSDEIPAELDQAKIKRRAKLAKVFMIKDANGAIETLILPIEGYGLWSTLYGFLALEGDLNTVKGISFYEHAETPGLGGEVDNPIWKAKWLGKKVYNEKGEVEARLIKGGIDPNSAHDKKYCVDALSGATLTSRGVSNLIHYWMGDEGFAPFLNNLKAGG